MVLFVIAVCYDLCTTFRTVLVVVCLVNENTVNSQLFKGHNIIFPGCIIEFVQSCLKGFPHFLHLLNGVAFSVVGLPLLFYHGI